MDDRPKVLLLITLSKWGGAQYFVYLLATHLYRRYHVTVACAPGGDLIPRLSQEGIRVIPVPELVRNPHPWRDFRALLRLVRLMTRERFDIVHVNSTKAGLVGRLAAWLAGVPVILFTAHGWPFGEGRAWWQRVVLRLAERFGARLSTKIVCVSYHDRDLAIGCHLAPLSRLAVIRYGLDPGRFRGSDERAVRKEFALRSGPVITFVGRLAPQKDPVTLLKAFREVSRGTLVIVGDGPLRGRVEDVVRQNDLGGRVILAGSRSDIAALLAMADVFVLSSRWEGLPLAIIEAMMSGLPVVATRVGGVPELVDDGVTGLLVPPGNAHALAAAVERVLSDTRLGRRMGAAGRMKALREFSLDRMLRETSRLYGEVGGTTGLRRAG